AERSAASHSTARRSTAVPNAVQLVPRTREVGDGKTHERSTGSRPLTRDPPHERPCPKGAGGWSDGAPAAGRRGAYDGGQTTKDRPRGDRSRGRHQAETDHAEIDHAETDPRGEWRRRGRPGAEGAPPEYVCNKWLEGNRCAPVVAPGGCDIMRTTARAISRPSTWGENMHGTWTIVRRMSRTRAAVVVLLVAAMMLMAACGADRPSTGAAVKESVAVDENTEHTAGITENATPSGAGNDSATTAGTAAEGALNSGDLTGRAGSDGAVKDGDAPSLDGEAVTAVGLGPGDELPAEVAAAYNRLGMLIFRQLLAQEASQAADVSTGGGGHSVFISPRSEEHTSELQSRENLVCRLLLEKKK